MPTTESFSSHQTRVDPETTGTSTKPLSRLSVYLPDCIYGSILITTRDKKIGIKFLQGQSIIIKVNRMSETETEQLLRKTLGNRISAEKAASLSARLEYLPLAITQAAAFIQENSISTDKYLQLLDKNDDTFVNRLSKLFETIRRNLDTLNKVTAT